MSIRSLQQNAGALINANLSYKATDGGRHKLEATFTKYSVAFRGDELPNGEKSDGVIISICSRTASKITSPASKGKS